MLEDAALEMAESLRKRLASGTYDEIDSGWILANTLTEELRGISRDKLLGVYFSPIANGPPTPGPYTVRPSAPSDCGFEDVEQPEGNVAYVKVHEFRDPGQCRERGEAILRALADSDAIVFDLTDTIGGHWGSHFLDPTQLSRIHLRAPEQIQTLKLDFGGTDVYVLTSSRTFSGGEAFAYDLQAAQRATVSGEITAGGAHPTRSERIDERFDMAMPWARVVNPITESNWERTGIQPDVATAADDALGTALAIIRQSP